MSVQAKIICESWNNKSFNYRMADFEELIGNPCEADMFVRESSPVWPEKPTPCNVKGCATED